MNEAVLDCLITGYEDLIPSLSLPDAGDRHIFAAAIRGRADVIVTFNLKHFRLPNFPNMTLSRNTPTISVTIFWA